MEVIVNTTCNINGVRLLEQNEKVQHLSAITLNSAKLKQTNSKESK